MKKVLKHDRVLLLSSLFESIDESRFLNAALLNINQLEEIDRNLFYPVDLQLYAEQGGLSLGKAYTEILEIVTKARETTVKVPLEDGSTWYTSIIYDFVASLEDKQITIRWNKGLIPYISGIMEAGKFCYYDPRLSAMSNVKAYKLAELLQKNLWKIRLYKEVSIPLEEIRRYTNTENVYPEFKEIARHIIKPCLNSLFTLARINITYSKKKSSNCVEFSLVERKEVQEKLTETEEETW